MNYQNHDQLERIKRDIPLMDYLEKAPKGARYQYKCPYCGSGDGPNGTGALTVYPETNTFTCFACNKSGDILDLFQEINQETFKESYKRACNILGERPEMPLESPTTSESDKMDKYTTETENAPKQVKNALKIDFSQEQRNFIMDNEPQAYLLSRGINIDTALTGNVGYNAFLDPSGKGHPGAFLEFPNTNGGILTRAIRPDVKPEYSKQIMGNDGLYISCGNMWEQWAYSDTGKLEPVYIVEAPIDALSIQEMGYVSIALSGASKYTKLLEFLDRKPLANKFIVASMDNDATGEKYNKLLCQALKDKGIKNQAFNWTGIEQKDVNELLTSNKELLAERLKDASIFRNKDNVKDYLEYFYLNEIEKNHAQKVIYTGFPKLDRELNGLHKGLYVIGAISSLGKTTLVHQIADNIASQGTEVLYFSLEQSRGELVSKSINRTWHQENGANEHVTGTRILNMDAPINYKETVKKYLDHVQGHLNVIEGNFNLDYMTLRQQVETFVNEDESHQNAVIIVDYLQILQYDRKSKKTMTDKERLDNVISGLKTLSRDLGVTVIAIASLNRANYLLPVALESFKESGAIEYTADVIIGLQLEIITSEDFVKTKTLTEQREKVNGALSQTPRRITLACLKNRYGKSSFDMSLNYWTKEDRLTESDKPTKKETREARQDLYKDIPIH